MRIPAYVSPSLCIGQTFDVKKAKVGSDVFPPYTPTKTIDINKYTFKWQVIETNKDARDLLDISSELSLLIKANLLAVSEAGQYISERRSLEGITEVLAVIKCNTMDEKVDELTKPNEDIISSQLGDVGTHFVAGVTYGAEIVASFKCKASASSSKQALKGSSEGQLNYHGHNAALKAQLEKLFTVLGGSPDISVRYYDTTLADNRLTSMQDVERLIEEFPSRLRTVKNGQGIPIQFELLPIQDIASSRSLNTVLMDEVDSRLDDLLNSQSLVKDYADANDTLSDDVSSFSVQVTKVFRKFRAAICTLSTSDGEIQMRACLEAYEKALDGSNNVGKFYQHWKKISTTNATQPSPTSSKFPEGKRLTVVLFGKTGNGKSATGNTILGENVFKVSSSASSVTAQCQYGSRTDEREIDVIDTPGVLDTSTISAMQTFQGHFPGYADQQKNILYEVSKIFAMAPFGFDAIVLVVKYGCRFTMEDAHALKMLKALLEENAVDHMILVLTHGDQAENEAEEENMSTEEHVGQWLKTLPSWVQSFISQIGNRVVLINNTLKPQKDQETCRKQLFKLVQMIDEMTKGRAPFTNRLTLASKDVVDDKIKESMKASGLVEEDERLEKEKAELERKMKNPDEMGERKLLELQLADIKRQTFAVQEKRNALVARSIQTQAKMSKEGSGGEVMERIQMQQYPISLFGGCFPASATFVDKRGRERSMDSLQIAEEVQVITEKGIGLEPVIAFIHREQNVIQKFLKITTKNDTTLKITEDHLLFVEREGQAVAIPARNVSIENTVYVRGDQGAVEKDAVHSISSIIEKGVYAPVTLSGTLLVNDVHTSCYFDVLSHEWSHRAMGAARAVYHVSPWMLQWISSIGQENGFPGWGRLAHEILTLMD